VEIFKTSWDELAITRTSKLVMRSLARGEDGLVRLDPTPELRAELQRAPGMKFAAFDIETKSALPGSAPELASALAPVIGISPTHTHIVLPSDPPTTPLGFMEPRWTPFGRLLIAVYRQKFRWDDVFHSIEADFEWLAIYLVAAILTSAATAWFAVRRGLAPLSAVAADAARIEMDSLHQPLSTGGVPAEVAPLVDSMNKALQRLDAGVARQKRFTANAAHELRTPVAILSARLDASEEPTFKLDLKRDARRIRNIVEQLLATSRLGERPGETNQEVDLVALVRSMVSDAALLAIKNKRQVDFEAPPTRVLVRGSRTALESVVANLIDNAIHAEPEGGAVLVRVRTDSTVEVIDHGQGVPESDRGLIFEPFWRKTLTTPGTGLGLAITKELVDLHCGRLWVEETSGGGATFKVSLQPLVI
jgi:two-component system OmpR family sensor kinase